MLFYKTIEQLESYSGYPFLNKANYGFVGPPLHSPAECRVRGCDVVPPVELIRTNEDYFACFPSNQFM